MSLADLVLATQAGDYHGPVTRAMATWDGETLDPAAVRRVHEVELSDITGARHDGTGRYRGSLLGMCKRMQMLSKNGYESDAPGEKGLAMMNDGTQRHYWWQKVGLTVGFLSDIEVKAWYEPWSFGGSLDGLMAPDEYLGDKGGFELKTTNPTKFRQTQDAGISTEEYMDSLKRGKAQLKHVIQTGGYMKALGLDYFSIVYEKRDWNVEWFEVVITWDEAREATEAMFGELLAYEEREQLPPVLPDYPKDKQCMSWCDYTRICPSAEF